MIKYVGQAETETETDDTGLRRWAVGRRTFALRMTLQLGPIQTIRMNFSRLDSLSFAYCTRAYAYDALLSSSWSRSSGSPPDPVAVSFSLSERSDCVSREQMGVACSVHMRVAVSVILCELEMGAGGGMDGKRTS